MSDEARKMRNKAEKINVIEYYNNSPTTDLIDDIANQYKLCDKHKHVKLCSKCLLAHDDNHKCYVYDRLFMSFMSCDPYMLFTHEQLKHFEQHYDLDHKKGCYTLEWNDVSSTITSIWVDGTEFNEDCCFISQRWYDYYDQIDYDSSENDL